MAFLIGASPSQEEEEEEEEEASGTSLLARGCHSKKSIDIFYEIGLFAFGWKHWTSDRTH